MKTVYISGPMRGRPGLNFPAFDKAKSLLESQGWRVISPVDADRREEGAGAGVEREYTVEDIRSYARRDIDFILNYLRAERGDALAVLPGSDNSDGARAEIALARWVRLPLISALSGTRIEYAEDVDYEWNMMQPAEFRSCGCGPSRDIGACPIPTGRSSTGPSLEAQLPQWAAEDMTLLKIAERMANEPYPLPAVNSGTSFDDFGL